MLNRELSSMLFREFVQFNLQEDIGFKLIRVDDDLGIVALGLQNSCNHLVPRRCC